MGGIEMVVKRIILWRDVHYIPISQPFQADYKTSFALHLRRKQCSGFSSFEAPAVSICRLGLMPPHPIADGSTHKQQPSDGQHQKQMQSTDTTVTVARDIL